MSNHVHRVRCFGLDTAIISAYRQADDLARYEQGTSGQPKGVVCEHLGLVAYMHAKARAHSLQSHKEAVEDGAGAGAEEGQGATSQRPSRVLITSAPTWDPSLGDIMSTLGAGAVCCNAPLNCTIRNPKSQNLKPETRNTGSVLCLAPRGALVSQLELVCAASRATHVLTTPALWDLMGQDVCAGHLPCLEVVALGGAPLPRSLIPRWLASPGIDPALGGEREEGGGGDRAKKEREGGRTGREGGEGTSTRDRPEGPAGSREVRAAATSTLRLLNTYGVTEATVYQTILDVGKLWS